MKFLRSLFGPSKDEIWAQIAADIGGDYIEGGFWGKDMLTYRHKEWEIVLDTFRRSSGKHSSTYTRMRVPFINKDSLYFTIYREGFFGSLGKMFGTQDIIIGDDFFDKDFIIKGNDAFKIQHLLHDENLKTLFSVQPYVSVKIIDDEGWFGKDYPEDVDVLYFETRGVIKDTDTLYGLFDLFSAILERLVHIDSAYEDDPGIDMT